MVIVPPPRPSITGGTLNGRVYGFGIFFSEILDAVLARTVRSSGSATAAAPSADTFSTSRRDKANVPMTSPIPSLYFAAVDIRRSAPCSGAVGGGWFSPQHRGMCLVRGYCPAPHGTPLVPVWTARVKSALPSGNDAVRSRVDRYGCPHAPRRTQVRSSSNPAFRNLPAGQGGLRHLRPRQRHGGRHCRVRRPCPGRLRARRRRSAPDHRRRHRHQDRDHRGCGDRRGWRSRRGAACTCWRCRRSSSASSSRSSSSSSRAATPLW